MWDFVLAAVVPTAGFGLFALLAMRFGAESRPGFDGRPVRDDRPNWPPIAGAGRRSSEPVVRSSGGGTPARAAAPARAPAPAERGGRPAAPPGRPTAAPTPRPRPAAGAGAA